MDATAPAKRPYQRAADQPQRKTVMANAAAETALMRANVTPGRRCRPAPRTTGAPATRDVHSMAMAQVSTERRWRTFADVVAFALGTNVWISIVILPAAFVHAIHGAWHVLAQSAHSREID